MDCQDSIYILQLVVTVSVAVYQLAVSPAGAGECAHMRPESERGQDRGFPYLPSKHKLLEHSIF